jgi:hypothetical protein
VEAKGAARLLEDGGAHRAPAAPSAATEQALAKARQENPRKTLSVFARRWGVDLQRRHEAGAVTFKTVDTHLRNLERFILPMLGRIDVDALKPRHVREWMRWVTTLKTLDERRGRGERKYKQASKPYAKATLSSAWRSLRAFTAGRPPTQTSRETPREKFAGMFAPRAVAGKPR